ncbi:hypothetical protein RUM44_001326 [Polyplax serrata]|uniref:Centrosomal protein kizuna n=1 Tax=Polyplax serrata TaxID=468196 RepID=A0ABR1AL85_POLSC
MIDSKEDLQLRMMELQQKLRDSEEERRKLERTCDVLVTTFREEHRMYYEALKVRYEKFLEDYNIRRRRNDIILRSLCRVEDRAKAIYAKTEKLKLLKDRYISYLMQNEFLKLDEPKLKSSSSLGQTITGDETNQKSVHWKTPYLADVREFNTHDFYNANEGRKIDIGNTYDTVPSEQNNNEYMKKSNLQCLSTTDTNKLKGNEDPTKLSLFSENIDFPTRSELNSAETNFTGYNTDKGEIYRSRVAEEALPARDSKAQNLQETSFSKTSSIRGPLIDDAEKNYKSHKDITETNSVKRSNEGANQESDLLFQQGSQYLEKDAVQRKTDKPKHEETYDKLKPALGKKNINHEGEAPLKSDEDDKTPIGHEIEFNNKEVKANNLHNEENYNEKKNLKDSVSICDDEDVGNNFAQVQENGSEGENSPNESKSDMVYPTGLDGVDYQNETYPESYYEQPEHHHNYSNISSNVILEEDEYEIEVAQTVTSTSDHLLNAQANESKKSPDQSMDSYSKTFDHGGLNIGSDISPKPVDISENLLNERVHSEEPKNIEYVGMTQEEDEMKYSKEPDLGNVETNFSDKSKSENLLDRMKSLTAPAKSNLVHLLESDSESFQIEHGDATSANDDSDFDFSFRQNLE